MGLVSLLKEMLLSGSKDLVDTIEEIEFPYQHFDFRLALNNSGPKVRNTDVVEVLIQVFCRGRELDDDKSVAFLKARTNIKSLAQVQTDVLAQFNEVLRMNPINYFICEKHVPLLKWVEALDLVETSVQIQVMGLFRYVLVDLNYVPFRVRCVAFSTPNLNCCSHST